MNLSHQLNLLILLTVYALFKTIKYPEMMTNSKFTSNTLQFTVIENPRRTASIQIAFENRVLLKITNKNSKYQTKCDIMQLSIN